MMFTRKIDNELSLALPQSSFAIDIYRIIDKDRKDLSVFTAWAKNNSLQDTNDFIKKALTHYANGSRLTCCMIYRGQLVGNVLLHSINHSLKKAELSYWLDTDFRGHGIVTKSCQKMIEIAFKELGLTKVELRCAIENIASSSVADRLGFTLEGVISQSEKIDNKVYDLACYGLHNV